ncbi:TonB-dependent receptor domain-containing protein [Bacteroidota bacterium]
MKKMISLQSYKAKKILMALIILFNLMFLNKVFSEPQSGTVTLNGYVRDVSNEETIIGASIFIVGTTKGAHTNRAGYFSVSGIKDGEITVRITSLGFRKKEVKINFKPGESVRRSFLLEPTEIMTDEVSVIAEREVEKRQISISKVNIPIKQIKEMRIGGEADVFRAIQMLPGVLTSSQISSGLYVRGGSPDQNLVLLDGTTVYNPSHLFGFFSAFNSDAIKDVELIKGGYPAEYGSRLSAVLNIAQKDGNRKEFEGVASLGVISSKLMLEGPIGNGSWFISGRRTYLDLVMDLMEEDVENPFPDIGFYDLNAKITQDLSENDFLCFSAFYSNDKFGYDNQGLEMGMGMGNRAAVLKWTHVFGDNLFSTVNLSASRYVNNMEQILSDSYTMGIENSITDFTLKAGLEWFTTDKLTLKTGLEVNKYRFHYYQNFTGADTTAEEGTNTGMLSDFKIFDYVYAGYLQANYQITELMSLQGGFRLSYWDLSEQLNHDPRLALRYQIFENLAVKASYGIFHQYLKLSGFENFSLFDTWLATDNTVDPSKSTHYIISFETSPIENFNLNFDFYYKDLLNISEQKSISLEAVNVSELFFSGNGEAYGFEVFLQKKTGNFVGWVGYGFGHVTATFDSINGGKEFNPKYDRRHDFKIVGNYRITDSWDIGGSFVFQSGQSYTGASSMFRIILPGQTYGFNTVVPSQKYGLRLPNSHQLNLNASYKFTMFGLPSRAILDIFNVYGRRDILSRTYEYTDEGTKTKDIELLPMIPTVSIEVKF